MYKMNRTICNIKYDIMSLSDKIDGLINKSEKTGYGEMLTDEDTFQKEIFQILPIENEEDLSLFESKLSNQEFRKKVVSLILKLILTNLINLIIWELLIDISM